MGLYDRGFFDIISGKSSWKYVLAFAISNRNDSHAFRAVYPLSFYFSVLSSIILHPIPPTRKLARAFPGDPLDHSNSGALSWTFLFPLSAELVQVSHCFMFMSLFCSPSHSL
jgi:hypothetical protein